MESDDSPGKPLAAFRNGERLSQRARSQALGFSGGRVSQTEGGYSTPSHDFLTALSDRYGVSADWLLYGHGDMLMPIGPGSGADGKDRIEPPNLGIYAFTRDGEAFAKRLAVPSTALDGTPASVLLISDNPAYPPVSLAGNDLESLKIVGRVKGVFAFC